MKSLVRKAHKLHPASLHSLTDMFATKVLELTGYTQYCSDGGSPNARTQCDGEEIALTIRWAEPLRKTLAAPEWAEIDVDVEPSSDHDYPRIFKACLDAAEQLGVPVKVHVNHMPELKDIMEGS